MLTFIFDIDDTLYERSAPFREAYRDQFGSRFELDTGKLYERFIEIGNITFEASMSGEMTMEEMWICRIRQAMEELNARITPEEALDFQKKYEWCQHHIRLPAVIAETFDFCLAKGIPLGCITNGTGSHQRMKWRALGLERWIPESRLLVTGDIGVNKPDPAVFEEAKRRMGFEGADAWYIGDSYKNDVLGAKAAGLHAIWFDRKQQAGGMTECSADRTVHSEEELDRCIRSIIQTGGKNENEDTRPAIRRTGSACFTAADLTGGESGR